MLGPPTCAGREVGSGIEGSPPSTEWLWFQAPSWADPVLINVRPTDTKKGPELVSALLLLAGVAASGQVQGGQAQGRGLGRGCGKWVPEQLRELENSSQPFTPRAATRQQEEGPQRNLCDQKACGVAWDRHIRSQEAPVCGGLSPGYTLETTMICHSYPALGHTITAQ